MKTIKDLQAENMANFMENGPRLSLSYNTWIVARDRKNGWVLVGGLGGLGVGQMWFKEDERDKNRPGYNEAPEQEYIDLRERNNHE